MSELNLIVIGLGMAGKVHAKALEHISGVRVIAGVDSDPACILTFRGCELPVYSAVSDASAFHHPDVVVIATPTRTHATVCDQVAKAFPAAAILVEKPAADNYTDALRLICGGEGRKPINVAFHMAFSPEVSWGLKVAHARAAEFGSPRCIQSSHTDPYQANLASAESRLGTSWIDSGINALSVIERFAKIVERRSLGTLGEASWSAFEGTFTCEAQGGLIEAVVLTSWHVTDPARTTRISYASGAELVMDHTAVAGYLVENGRIAEIFGSDGSVSRRESHYRALYKWWLVDDKPIAPVETSMRLHDLLLRPT
jgi:predicted dehydrogenase